METEVTNIIEAITSIKGSKKRADNDSIYNYLTKKQNGNIDKISLDNLIKDLVNNNKLCKRETNGKESYSVNKTVDTISHLESFIDESLCQITDPMKNLSITSPPSSKICTTPIIGKSTMNNENIEIKSDIVNDGVECNCSCQDEIKALKVKIDKLEKWIVNIESSQKVEEPPKNNCDTNSIIKHILK